MLFRAVSVRVGGSRLGDNGAGIPLTSLGMCNICEIGLICRFEEGMVRDIGDLACCGGGVGKDFGGMVLGEFRANRGE
jgi:hypothetical protein